jgi:Ca-activated chloride channel family protein
VADEKLIENRRVTCFYGFLITFLILPVKVAGVAKAQEGNLMFILDASGSMWGQVEGQAKIVITKEVMAGLIADQPEGINVGLVAYGHRRKGDCTDVEELTPLGVLDKKELINQIKAISPPHHPFGSNDSGKT